MAHLHIRRDTIAVALSFVTAALPARALVNIDEGRNQVFVTGTFNMGYDSNLFASSSETGDVLYSVDLSSQFVRHAGLIGMNASIGVNATRYGKYTSENFQNPRLQAEFTKQTGRTTGSLSLGAQRQSRADTAANLRTESWNYDATLNVTYPILAGRYSVSANVGYSLRDFKDNTLLFDLNSYTAGAELNYLLPGDSRSLILGYRFRDDVTSSTDRNIDHAFSLGITGRLFYTINGAIRAGYEVRKSEGLQDQTFGAWTLSASSTWAFTRRISITGQVAKDFATTATNISVDSISSSLGAQYAWSSKTSYSAGTGLGTTRFLGTAGQGRKDTNWNWNLGASHKVTSHLDVRLSYNYSRNWSNVSFSDFSRRSANFSATSQF